MHVHLHFKCLLFLLYFKQSWNILTNFSQIENVSFIEIHSSVPQLFHIYMEGETVTGTRQGCECIYKVIKKGTHISKTTTVSLLKWIKPMYKHNSTRIMEIMFYMSFWQKLNTVNHVSYFIDVLCGTFFALKMNTLTTVESFEQCEISQ